MPFSVLRRRPRPEHVALALILLVAAWLRLRGVNFGLPSLYDPDEPIFVLVALKLLRQGTLNPAWFGHPGTTTIYALALIYAAIFGIGLATGRFPDAPGIGKAIYTNPGIVFLPGRCFIAFCALAVIVLTFVLARRLFGARVGLIAAALLCISPIHIKYSQIIRTDMHETVFLLLSVLSATNIVRHGRMRDYVWAAIWLGIACATKWPAATMASAIIGASAWRMAHGPEGWRTALIRLVLAGPITVAALLITSPYIVIDFPTVVSNLTGEARTHHPGATGFGFWGNAVWYLTQPTREAVGLAGMALAAAGLIAAARRSAAFAVTALPFLLVSFVAICAQSLVWDRWIVPLLPFIAIAIAIAIEALAAYARDWKQGWRVAGWAAVAAVVAAPLIVSGDAAAVERAHDTRSRASAWARGHIPPGSTVVVEILAFDLLGTGWRFLYPLGDAGCIDVAERLRTKMSYTRIEQLRGGRAVIDLGTINPTQFAACRANYAMLTNYDRYLHEPQVYAQELVIYRALLARGTIVASFRPEPGRSSGPTVHIVRLNTDPALWHALPPAPAANSPSVTVRPAPR